MFLKVSPNEWQMYEIREGLRKKVNVKLYAYPEIPDTIMKKIRLKLQKTKSKGF